MNNNYNTNIEHTRMQNNNAVNINQNPYINQMQNQVQNQNMNQMNPNNNPQEKSGFNNADFIKGALIGAAVTFLLTNKGTQETLMKATSKGTELFQAGMEELKERYEDARAQMEANQV